MLSNSFKDLKKPFSAFSEVAPPLPISAKRFFWLTPIVSNNVVIALESLELETDEENETQLLYTALEKVAKRYSKNYEGYERKQKVTQALARKGFSYDDISSALRDYTFPE